jgi:hypothetical protein
MRKFSLPGRGGTSPERRRLTEGVSKFGTLPFALGARARRSAVPEKDRLSAGKRADAKPALIACMRKFLIILNAMLHNKTPWRTPALASSTLTFSPLSSAVPEHGCC